MRAMISQPMRGFTDEQIEAVRAKAKEYLELHGYEVVDTFFQDQWKKETNFPSDNHKAVWFMAKVIEKMATVDAVYFCDKWQSARGCRVEHYIAEQYGLGIIYEE